MHFELAYRPPYDWESLLAFLSARAVAGVEIADAGGYRRTLAIERGGALTCGWIGVAKSRKRNTLRVDVAASLAPVVPAVLARVRHAFDLACDPAPIAARLGPLAARRPGLRVP
jgi:AraC family transcriptional regulator of adaptative response / DNA-3-methyladenine glycosylase II